MIGCFKTKKLVLLEASGSFKPFVGGWGAELAHTAYCVPHNGSQSDKKCAVKSCSSVCEVFIHKVGLMSLHESVILSTSTWKMESVEEMDHRGAGKLQQIKTINVFRWKSFKQYIENTLQSAKLVILDK